MRKKKTHSNSSISALYHDFSVYKDLKNLQKTSNPYSRTPQLTKTLLYPYNPPKNPIEPLETHINNPKISNKKVSKEIEQKSQQIADTIENQIRKDVKNFSEIGENALSSFREKVSLYNSYFTRYLFENHQEISRNDLVVQQFSLFPTKEEEDSGILSPHEKFRRQKQRGTVFGEGFQKEESLKTSPHSPKNNRNKSLAFGKESYKIKRITHLSRQESKKIEIRYENINMNNKGDNVKKQYKNTWEYYYHLGQSDLAESQKKMEKLKKTLKQDEELDDEKKEFFQLVKRGEVDKVKKFLEDQKKRGIGIEKRGEILNSVDSYVSFVIFLGFLLSYEEKLFYLR